MASKKLKLSIRVTIEQRDMLEKMRIAAGKKSLEDYMRCAALSGSNQELLSEVGRQIGDCARVLLDIAARAELEGEIEPEKLDRMIDNFVAIITLLREKLRFVG